MLRTAVANIHNDRLWWRKVLIGGALSCTIFGYFFSAGLVVENMDNTRRGYPTPLPPWADWSTRFLIGLFASLIDFLFYLLPWLLALMIFFCVAIGLLVAQIDGVGNQLALVIVATLLLYMTTMFLSSVSAVGRLILIDDSSPERAMSGHTLREALRPAVRGAYFRARLIALPAYLPFLLMLGLTIFVGQYAFDGIWPLLLICIWLTLAALLYGQLIVGQVYAMTEQMIGGVMPRE
ncbi:MAG TPA: DUF4013 domain-containing protein [Roseiflexaceae bacterium]|nr:DUF4013 domain-containing protein [Roseiflexaceae bacterium]HMP42944.1 DUF4013 domain-containing protein [Roseiflexaceae bacterium]